MAPQRTTAPTAISDRKQAWIEAIRPRTLPLAAAGSIVAAGIAAAKSSFRVEVFVLMLVVSVALQIIANFADDYGDLAHGLDDDSRIGPRRGMQRGVIAVRTMKTVLALSCVATFLLGCLLLFVALGAPSFTLDPKTLKTGLIFVALGLAAIAAAVLYTVGPHPYGYRGLGDIMSFIFFGLVAVIGGSFLYTGRIDTLSVVSGIALGVPVAAVMNVNNMRDSTDDASKGKFTLANRLYSWGARNAQQACYGKTDEEIVGISSLLEHGPKTRAAAINAELAREGQPAWKRLSDPNRASALAGEAAMRGYHLALGYGALALFCIAILLEAGINFHGIVGVCAVLAGGTPYMRAVIGACRERDHTKLDKFMAPTSMGAFGLAVIFAAALALL